MAGKPGDVGGRAAPHAAASFTSSSSSLFFFFVRDASLTMFSSCKMHGSVRIDTAL